MNAQLKIDSDKNIKQISLEDTQNQKQNILNKAQIATENQHASTAFRKRLFQQGSGFYAGKAPFLQKNLNVDYFLKKDGQYFNKANLVAKRNKEGIGAPLKMSHDMQIKIDKMFNFIEQTTQQLAG